MNLYLSNVKKNGVRLLMKVERDKGKESDRENKRKYRNRTNSKDTVTGKVHWNHGWWNSWLMVIAFLVDVIIVTKLFFFFFHLTKSSLICSKNLFLKHVFHFIISKFDAHGFNVLCHYLFLCCLFYFYIFSCFLSLPISLFFSISLSYSLFAPINSCTQFLLTLDKNVCKCVAGGNITAQTSWLAIQYKAKLCRLFLIHPTQRK